jgi:hypothetical protein
VDTLKESFLAVAAMQFHFFHVHLGEDEVQYTFNLAMVSDICRENPDSWEVTTASGRQYTLEEDDLDRFREVTGL